MVPVNPDGRRGAVISSLNSTLSANRSLIETMMAQMARRNLSLGVFQPLHWIVVSTVLEQVSLRPHSDRELDYDFYPSTFFRFGTV